MKITALVSILVPIVQGESDGAIAGVFFKFIESCIFFPLCASAARTITYTNFKNPNIFPMRFGSMLIYNKLIELPHLKYFRRYRGGRIPPQLNRNTSIEVYDRKDTGASITIKIYFTLGIIIFCNGSQMNSIPRPRYFHPYTYDYIGHFVTPVAYLKLWVRCVVLSWMPGVRNSMSSFI